MARLREDQFIYRLRILVKEFPEFAPILRFLIQELKKGQKAQIVSKLQMLQREHW